MSIRYLKGNIVGDAADLLVNPVNTEGVMGAGVALAFKRRWPEIVAPYEQACRAGSLRAGGCLLFPLRDGRHWAALATKDRWREPSRLAWIESGLELLGRQAANLRVRSIAIPPVGCGLGGLDWADVRPLIISKLSGFDLRIYGASPVAPQSRSSQAPANEPRLLNFKRDGVPPGAVYVGRDYKDKVRGQWGNPFHVNYQAPASREQAVDRFDLWFAHPDQNHLFQRLDELKDRDLVCWCVGRAAPLSRLNYELPDAPKDCHGRTLLYLANVGPEEREAWRSRKRASPAFQAIAAGTPPARPQRSAGHSNQAGVTLRVGDGRLCRHAHSSLLSGMERGVLVLKPFKARCMFVYSHGDSS